MNLALATIAVAALVLGLPIAVVVLVTRATEVEEQDWNNP